MTRNLQGISELEATGIAISAMEDAPYQQAATSLATGDILVLYTDGVTEAVNGRNEMYETERLVAVVKENRKEPARQILDSVIRDVMDLSRNQPQYDNITLMIVKVPVKVIPDTFKLQRKIKSDLSLPLKCEIPVWRKSRLPQISSFPCRLSLLVPV